MFATIVRTTAIAAIAAGFVATSVLAGTPTIYQAILAEANQKTPDISTEEMRRIVAAGGLIVDTRTRAEFNAGHIPGAHSLEGSDHVAAVERLAADDKARPLVLYCNGPYCQASRRLADQLVAAGFTGVRRYQLGLPIWRALGGPTVIEQDGILRVFSIDKTAVFLDVRSAEEFANGSLAEAHNVPVDDVISGKLRKMPLPEDDFNRRIVLFGRDGADARRLADVLSTRPWHNVAYFPGSFESLRAMVRSR